MRFENDFKNYQIFYTILYINIQNSEVIFR